MAKKKNKKKAKDWELRGGAKSMHVMHACACMHVFMYACNNNAS
jgi:hypothetical protein